MLLFYHGWLQAQVAELFQVGERGAVPSAPKEAKENGPFSRPRQIVFCS